MEGVAWELVVCGRHDCGDQKFVHVALLADRTLTLIVKVPDRLLSYAAALVIGERICEGLAGTMTIAISS
ncbi:MAG TPA: hypothetical protein VFP91_01755 [Vicinamibacterales bacterium]|nr:hypothetical protein [Vicinamibacterales bacterium]